VKPDGEITVTSLGPQEGALLRDLRIRSLSESPDAFGPTAEEARQHPDGYWEQAARRIAVSEQEIFVARRDGEPVGLVSAVLDREGTGHIGAMWVDPAARGLRLGARLLDTACRFLEEGGSGRLRLWVTETNAAAIALYEKRGFAPTGGTKPLREGSPLSNVEMERPPATAK